MDISKNSLLRFLLYIGIIISSASISNYVDYHFLYVIKRKIFCPSLGAVSVCEDADRAGWIGVVVGNALIGLVMLQSSESLKHNRKLRRLECFICFIEVLRQLWFGFYFLLKIAEAGTGEDMRLCTFVSFFALNTLLFAINGILSLLEDLKRERIRS